MIAAVLFGVRARTVTKGNAKANVDDNVPSLPACVLKTPGGRERAMSMGGRQIEQLRSTIRSLSGRFSNRLQNGPDSTEESHLEGTPLVRSVDLQEPSSPTAKGSRLKVYSDFNK